MKIILKTFRKPQNILTGLIGVIFLVSIVPFLSPVSATAGINRTVNFQGKIVNKTDGTNITSQSYSFTFKFYDSASGGTQLPSGAAWSETQSLTVTDGIFRAILGSVTPIPSTLNFNDDSIYLDVTFNGEVFGSRVRMTAVPYAFNAEKVGGLTVTNTTGTLTIPNAKTISFADAFTTSGANPLTLTTTGTTNVTLPTSGLLFSDTNNVNFLDASTGTAYAINGSDATSGTNAGGNLTVRAGNASSSGTGGDLILAGGTTSGGTAGNITFQTAGGTKWSISNSGALTSTGAQTIATTTGALTLGADIVVGASKSLRLTGGAGDPTATSGIIWYDTTANKFKIVENGTVKIVCNTTDAGCGAGGSTLWSTIGTPTGNLALSMAAYTSTFTYNDATGSNNLFNLTDTTSNSGTGYLLNVTTATGSSVKPLHVSAAGIESLMVTATGNVGIGTTSPASKLEVKTSNTNLTGKAAVIVNQLENQDLLTASSSGLTRFTVTNTDVKIAGRKTNISSSSVNKIFIYDTSSDIDGGRWTTDDKALNSSWYNETLNTATRGSQAPFPRKAVLIGTNDNLYIYDAKDNTLWMRFDQASNTALDVAANNEISSVHALNGKIFVGTNGAAATGMYEIDFIKDKITRFNATDARDYAGGISGRNTSQTVAYANQSRTGLALVNATVNGVRAEVVGGKTYVVVSTNGGTNGSTTVINETTQTVLVNFGPASIPTKESFLTPNGTLYSMVADSASPSNYALKVRYNITTATGNNQLYHAVYINRSGSTNYGVATVDNNTFASIAPIAGPAPIDNTFIPNSLYVTQGTSVIDGKSNTIYVGNNDNLMVIQEKQDDLTNGSVKYYTKDYITGDMTGDIRAAYPLDTTYGSGLNDASVKGTTLSNGGTAPTYNTTGVRGKAANLGASAATATSTSSNLLIPASTGITLAAWVQPTTLTVTNGTREVFVSADANSANVVSWGIGTKGDGTNANLYCYAGNTTPTLFEINSNIAAVANEWYRIVLTADASGNLKCYVDGSLVGTSTLTGTAQTPTRFQIGATQATTAMNAVRGNVDEVQVTAEVASAALIRYRYDVSLRALNGHGAITFRGTAVSADRRNQLNGSSNQVNGVFPDLEAGRLYVGTNGGGVTMVGMGSDTINDILSTAATDDSGSALGSATITSVVGSKGYGTNSFVAVGHGTGFWIETVDTNIKEFMANGYNPFGSSLSQSNLNVDTLFRVTNQASSRNENLAQNGTSQNGISDILRVDQNGTYAGANVMLGSRPDSTSSTAFNALNQAAGQFGADTNIRGATSSAIYKGKLFVATRKADAAGVYRYDGGGNWTLVTNAVGKVVSGDTANIDGYAMTVWNNQLVIGSQTGPTGATGAIYTSTNADIGTSSTTSWTLVNTTRGRFNTTTGIDGVSDLAVYNGTLHVITDEPNGAEIYRYLGGTGTSVFTKISIATAGQICTGDATDADGGVFTVFNGRLFVGIRTASTTARVCWYAGTTTNPDITWTLVNTTRGRLGGYNGGASTTGMIDITGMTVYNGALWMTAVKAANSMEIYRLKGDPTASQADPFQRMNQTVGKLVAADAANIDGAVLRSYQGRLYVGTQTAASTGAVYEFEQNVADNFVLINTTRGTFGSDANIDDVAILQPFNDPTSPGGGAVLFMGTDDAGKVSGVYSWQKFLSQSYALRMDSGSQNLGSLMFTSDDQTVDNAGRSGKFVFSHGVNLASGAFDYAEDYPTLDDSIEAGDVVTVDPNNKEFVVKAVKSMPLVGVVSEDPGFRLQQRADKINGNKYIPIALVGRVPVKVSTENGPIKAGDYLTASSFYGVAMKATRAGAIIGQAMEDYNEEGQGKIIVYVQTGQITGSVFAALPGLSTDEEESLNDMDGDRMGMRILRLLMKENEKLEKDPNAIISEVFTDRVSATKEVIAPHIIADLITARKIKAESIEGLEIYTNKLSGLDENLASLEAKVALLKEASSEAQREQITQDSKRQLLVNGLDVEGSATVSANLHVWGSGIFDGILNVLDSITTPNLIVGRWADFIGTVIFRSDVNFIGRPTFNKDTAGYAVIKKDAKTVTIVFEKEYKTTPVVNTTLTMNEVKKDDGTVDNSTEREQNLFDQSYTYYIARTSTKGFTIVLNKSATDDVHFSWVAFAVEEGKTSEGVSAGTSLLTPILLISPVVPTIFPEPTGEAATFSADTL